MALGKSLSEHKTLSVVQLCEMQDGVIYVNTNSVTDCVSAWWVVLRLTWSDNFTLNTEWYLYVKHWMAVIRISQRFYA